MKQKILHEKYCRWLLRKLPREENSIQIMGVCGLEVILPFTKEQMNFIELEFLEEYIRKIMAIYEYESCYFDKELLFISKRFFCSKQWILKYILLEDGLQKFFNMFQIQKKDAKYVLIDGENQKIEMLLQLLVPDANYMTIVTKRDAFFCNAVEEVLEASGLLMEIIKYPISETINGNVAIFLSGSPIKLYSKLSKGSYVIDMDFTERKLDYVLSRRKDLTILYDFEVDFNGENIDKDLAAEIMIQNSWKIKRFYEKSSISLCPYEMEQVKKVYKLSIKSLKIIKPNESMAVKQNDSTSNGG